MKTKFLYIIIWALSFGSTFGQISNSEVLFTVEDKTITAGEFIRVYNKNIDLVKDESQKDIDAYLDLYINYHLKLLEAKRLELDKDISYQREFTSYKNQLTRNYLADSKVTDELVKEAYDRVSYDLKGVHILLRMDETEQDTIAAYNKLIKLRDQLASQDFDKLKAELHDGQQVFVEDLGYFTGFKMVYPFESAAYSTKVGEVSMPFRTRFGLHVVKILEKRPSRGEVKVAHIMVAKNKSDSLVNPQNRIEEIYTKLNQGEDFSMLAQQFSDDKSSAKLGGELAPFQGGQLSSKEFEDVAFGLETAGDVSKPFESDFGWHIVKLIEKRQLQTFEEMKPELEVKVKRDSRSNLINSALIVKLKEQYKINENKNQLAYFKSILNEDYLNKKWILPQDFNAEGTIIEIDSFKVKNEAFGSYLLSKQNSYDGKKLEVESIVEIEFQKFIDDKLKSYHENNLENTNEEFAFILQEYRDGLLLFDLMENEIWNAAAKDSVGLTNFYENNKKDYMWPQRFRGSIITSSDKKVLSQVVKSIKKGKTITELKTEMNSDDDQKFIVTQGTFDTDHPLIPGNFDFRTGISEAYMLDNSFSVMMVDEVLAEGPKTLEQAKGRVISDYQNKLEEDWIKKLKERYKVKLNNDVLTRVKIKLLN